MFSTLVAPPDVVSIGRGVFSVAHLVVSLFRVVRRFFGGSSDQDSVGAKRLQFHDCGDLDQISREAALDLLTALTTEIDFRLAGAYYPRQEGVAQYRVAAPAASGFALVVKIVVVSVHVHSHGSRLHLVVVTLQLARL
jgi:hypothetical protein